MNRSRPRQQLLPVLAVAVLLIVGGCGLAGGTLGGREKCWTDERAASLWRGILGIDGRNASLVTAEGEAIPLWPGALGWRIGADGVGELTRGDEVVARAGDDLTLFGGVGADGFLLVCAVEERQAG